MKKIKDMRSDKGMTVPQSREGTTRVEAAPEVAAPMSDQKPSLKIGQYDEGESHNQFLEALNAWRSAGPAAEKPEKKVVTFSDENSIKQMEDQPLRRPQPQPTAVKKVSKKESCWNCYKLYIPNPVTETLKNKERCFCSGICHKKYSITNSKTCQLEDCGKMFLKAQGEYVHGRWFCNDDCAEKDP